MIKKLIFILLLASATYSLAGGFPFPNFEYKYAKLHLFNVDPSSGSQRFDFHIFHKGVYAGSKLGDGFRIEDEILADLHGIIVRGVDELRYGMSKCYTPRHGIIYYNDKYEPVGSLSICFECEKISFSSINELPPMNDDYTSFNYKKAGKQLESIKKQVIKIGAPVYDNPNDYKTYRDSSFRFKQANFIEITNNQLDSLYLKPYQTADVYTWILNQQNYSLSEGVEKKTTAGGDVYEFKRMMDGNGTVLLFSNNSESAYLVDATINSPYLKFPTGVSVGMSLEEVIGSLGIYDGPAYPDLIILKGENLKIMYYFSSRTLIKIEASFIIY